MESDINDCIDTSIPKDAVEVKVTNMINPYFIRIYEVSNTNTKRNNLTRKLEAVLKDQLKKQNINRQELNIGHNVIVASDRVNNAKIDLPNYVCRGILTDKTSTVSEVFCIDYGIAVVVPTESLVRYSGSQVPVEPLTLTVSMYNIVPVDSKLCIIKNWPDSTLTFLKELFQVSQKIYFQVLANEENTMKLYGDFYLVIDDRNICLSKVLIRSHLVVPVGRELKKAIKSESKMSDTNEPISISYEMGIPKDDLKDSIKKSDLVSVSEKKKIISKQKFALKEKILIQSDLSVKPLEHISDSRFTTVVNKALSNNGVRAPKQIQKYMWPAIMEGFNVVAIDEKGSGKTIGHLVPMISHVTEREENKLEEKKHVIATEPSVLILCPTVSECINVTSICKQLLYGCKNIKTYAVFNGLPEDEILTNVLNKFNILITVPPFLNRLLSVKTYSSKLNFSKLSCLILDQADLVIQKYEDDLHKLLKKIIEDSNDRNILQSGKMQILAVSETWTDKLKLFIERFMVKPFVCIGSYVEAASYCNVKGRMIICHSDKKMNQLLDILGDYKKKKTIVFCINSEEAIKLDNFLSKSIETALVHENMKITSIEAIRENWNKCVPGMYPLIICTDEVAMELYITNIEYLIHYTVTNISKTKFNQRFFVCIDNWIKEIQNKCKITVLFDESKENIHFKGVISILKRLKVELPSDWDEIAHGLDFHADLKKKNHPICDTIKIHGFCKNNSCSYRHRVFEEVDKPLFNIAIGDEVKLQILTVHSASHFSVSILEIIGKKSEFTDKRYRTQIMQIPMKIRTHFGNANNRILEKDIVPGKICAYRNVTNYSRVRIKSIVVYDSKTDKPKKVSIQDIDGGKIYEQAFVYDLFELPETLAKIQLPTMDVYVTNIGPFDEEIKWTDIATDATRQWYLDHFNNTEYFYAKVLLVIGNCLFVEYLNTRFDKSNIISGSLTKHLLSKKLVTKNEDHLKNLIKLCIRGGLTNINGVPLMLTDETQNSIDVCD